MDKFIEINNNFTFSIKKWRKKYSFV